MKKLIKIILVALLFAAGSQCASAQTFSKMSETNRNAELTKIARKIYHSKVFERYYKLFGDNGKSKVTSYTIVEELKKTDMAYGRNIGKLQYRVSLYSLPRKDLGSIAAVKVIISDKTGEAWYIRFDSDGIVYTRWNTPEAFK